MNNSRANFPLLLELRTAVWSVWNKAKITQSEGRSFTDHSSVKSPMINITATDVIQSCFFPGKKSFPTHGETGNKYLAQNNISNLRSLFTCMRTKGVPLPVDEWPHANRMQWSSLASLLPAERSVHLTQDTLICPSSVHAQILYITFLSSLAALPTSTS